MEYLPTEMVINIVDKLQGLDLLSLNKVSKRFYLIINPKIRDRLEDIHKKWLSLRWMYYVNIIGGNIKIFTRSSKLGKFKIKRHKIVFCDPNSIEYTKIKYLKRNEFPYIYQGKCMHNDTNNKTLWKFIGKGIENCIKEKDGLKIVLIDNSEIAYNIHDPKIYVILDIIIDIKNFIKSKISF